MGRRSKHTFSAATDQNERDSPGWQQVKTKEKKCRAHHQKVGQYSSFQLYVTFARNLSAQELGRVFEQHGELSEPVILAPNFPGVAFVKYRTRASAQAAVSSSPVQYRGLSMVVKYLDLQRRSKHAEWNRKQERQLIRDEPGCLWDRPRPDSPSSMASDGTEASALSEAHTIDMLTPQPSPCEITQPKVPSLVISDRVAGYSRLADSVAFHRPDVSECAPKPDAKCSGGLYVKQQVMDRLLSTTINQPFSWKRK